MPTYEVTIVQQVEIIKTVTVVAADDTADNLGVAVNSADESEFTTVSTRVMNEETLSYTETA